MRQIFILAALLLGFATSAVAQNKTVEALNQEIRRAEEEIRKNTALLNETQKNKASSQREIKLIRNRIASRQKMLSALKKQIEALSDDLSTNRSSVKKLESELSSLKGEYAGMIRESYKNYLQNNYLAFLFASKDFNDVTRRINYMRRYNAMRERKALQIDSLSGVIAVRIEELDHQLVELDRTKATETAELNSLGKDEKQFQSKLATLKSQESKINREIVNRRAQIQKAQREIARMVAAETKKTAKKTLTADQQREVKELSGRFDQNKGKLPWPVRGGVIIDRYGLHPHATQKGLTVDNKGINIAAGKGAEVRSVFEGTVANIFFYQGLNNNVMVRHGEYITVYSNLASVAVKVGDKVTLNQVLGRLPSGGDEEEYALHFEVWKLSANLNPEQWLID